VRDRRRGELKVGELIYKPAGGALDYPRSASPHDVDRTLGVTRCGGGPRPAAGVVPAIDDLEALLAAPAEALDVE
jgi:hypothetical protein